VLHHGRQLHQHPRWQQVSRPGPRRAAPRKPIRIFQQDGSNDIVNQFGSWPEANKAMAAALKEKGYDHKFVFGEGVHSGNHGTQLFPEAMRWIWRDWKQ
jgi:hypothetical protein